MCYTIEEIQTKAIPIAKSYGIKKMSLFGSYARGEANDESDVVWRVMILLYYIKLLDIVMSKL